jgi:hypothetical protein
MKYFLLKFFLIGIVFFIGVETLLIFIDSKQNGFFTQTVNQNITAIERNKSIEITFIAHDNNFGTVALPLTSQKKGNVIFKMKENGAKDWLYQNTYNSEAFNQLSPYPFGFSVIPESKNKKYTIEVGALNTAHVHLTHNTIQTKYAYSKEELTSHKQVLIAFILKKYYNLLFTSPVWFLSIFFAFVLLKSKQTISSLGSIIKKILTFFYLAPPSLFILSLLFLLLHKQVYAEKFIEWTWIASAIVILQVLFINIKNFLEEKSEKQIQRYVVISFFIISSLALVIAAFNKTYLLGGDDSRTFYLYPVDFFNNQASHVGPDGSVSSLVNFLPPTSIAAFIFFIIFLKKIFFMVNLQMFLFVCNVIGGIVFFYYLIDYFIPGKNLTSFFAKAIGSLLYVFSIFNFYTLFNSQLISMYLISTFPLSIYLYMRSIREGKIYLLALVAIIGSIFSFFVVSLPWFLAGILAVSPFIVLFFWKQKRRFILYNLLLALMFLLLNAYWIYAIPFSLVSESSVAQGTAISSDSFRKEMAEGIISTTEINKVFFPLLNLYHYDIQANFKWAFFPIFTSWYLMLLSLNSLFIFLIILTGIKMKRDPLRRIYAVGVLSLLASIYFFTVNIGSNGTHLFLFLNDHVPGFVMFRNMYDKFGFAVAISFAVLISVCLQYFLNNEKRNFVKKGILFVAFSLILLNAKPFLLNDFYSLPIWTTANTYNSITGFNKDYLDLVKFIKQQDNPSRYLWLPLNRGNISQIQDPNESNHYYSGVSPLLFLSGKNDYSGVTSFEGSSNEITKLILDRKYTELGKLYQKFNVRYIIVNHTITSDIKQSYICNEKLCDSQDKKYEKAILGKKIKDFGSRYSLYEINPLFANDKLSLQGKGKIAYKKINSDQYTIELSSISKNSRLVFLDPYFSNWEIVSRNNYPIQGSNHFKIYNYANAWDINTDVIRSTLPKSEYKENADGTVDISLTMQFQKHILYPIIVFVSIASYITIFGYIFILLIPRILDKIKKWKNYIIYLL